MNEITQATVCERFNYNSETGKLIIKIKYASNVKVGEEAGNLHPEGYRRVKIYGVNYLVHRLVWLLHHGKFPKLEIDHINGVRDDNRIENLREATSSQNSQNMSKPMVTNKLAMLGVCKHKKCDRYRATIRVNNKNIYLGLFKTPEAAHNAYIAAKKNHHEYGTL